MGVKAFAGIERRFADRRRRLAANPEVAEAGRPAVVLKREKAGEGLGADLGNALLVNLLDQPAIHDDADPRSDEAHFELVPFPGRADGVFQRGDVAVEGARGVRRRRAPGIVEELELVAAEARPRGPRPAPVKNAGAHSDAGVAGLAVGLLAEPKLHPQRDVGKRLAGIAQEAEAETVAVDLPLLDAPHRAAVGMDFRVGVGFDHPAIERMAVEDRLKALLGSAEGWSAGQAERQHYPQAVQTPAIQAVHPHSPPTPLHDRLPIPSPVPRGGITDGALDRSGAILTAPLEQHLAH